MLTAVINNTARLCDLLEIDSVKFSPQENRLHGCGEKGLDPVPIKGTCELTIHDINEKPFNLLFELLRNDSYGVIGLDVGKYCI